MTVRKFGLIGYPLGHSFSKGYFASKFSRENIRGCEYENYPLESIDMLPGLLSKEKELCGLNVTIPYKSAVIPYLNHIDAEASEIGAVNVVRIRHYGKELSLSGYNSDITGIRTSLGARLEGRRNALVLGTGGASRAVSWVLLRSGLSVQHVSRERRENAIAYEDVSAKLLTETDIIVNTTPLGMYPSSDTKPEIDYDCLGERHILFDLVYNPEITAFMQEGIRRGCIVIGGLEMLHSQAERAWEIWNDDSL